MINVDKCNVQRQNMKNNILKVVRKYIQDEQKQIMNKNTNKIQSTDHKLKKTLQQQMFNTIKQDQLYDQLVTIADKLRKIKKRINNISNIKIKKQKLAIFNPKLLAFISQIQNIIQTKSINIKIDKQISYLIFQTHKSLTQCDRILTSFQKQFNAFFCARNQQTKYSFYRAMINIISYGKTWSIIPKFTPMIQQKTSKIQILTPIKLDFNYLDYQIQKEIKKYWPQTKIIQQYIQCLKKHIESNIQQKSLQVSQLSHNSSQLAQYKLKQIIQNYVKKQDYLKLKQNLQIESKLRIAHQKLYGFGRPQQILSAIQTYNKISDNKDYQKIQQVYNILGQIYEEGKFQSIDRQKSEYFYNLSAKLNNSQGLYKIGKYLQKGLILIQQKNNNNLIQKNNSLEYKKNNSLVQKQNKNKQIRKTIQYYQKAAQLNHLDAITDLGYIYEKGIQNMKQIKPSKSVIQQSYSEVSQSNIKTVKQLQYLIQPNYKYAIKYYNIAKKYQYPRALNNLGALLIRQNQYIPQKVKGTNLQKGIKYLKKAANLNYIKSFFNLAKCYQNGTGVKQDLQIAKCNYIKGSQKGDINCKIQSIKCQLRSAINGNKQDKDQIQTEKILQLIAQIIAHDHKNLQCYYYLGLLYQNGNGVIKNPQLAFQYINKSAKNNFTPAITKLGDYYYSGFHVNKNLQQAFKLYQKAASFGQSQAMINLSLMIQKGIIKPTQVSNKQAVNKLNKQALIRNNSNAYLIQGLKQMNNKLLTIKSKQQLNSKILRSLQMKNTYTQRLVQKIQYNYNVNSNLLSPKINKQLQQQKNSKYIIQNISQNNKTLKFGKLNKAKSTEYIKTFG